MFSTDEIFSCVWGKLLVVDSIAAMAGLSCRAVACILRAAMEEAVKPVEGAILPVAAAAVALRAMTRRIL